MRKGFLAAIAVLAASASLSMAQMPCMGYQPQYGYQPMMYPGYGMPVVNAGYNPYVQPLAGSYAANWAAYVNAVRVMPYTAGPNSMTFR